MNKEDMYLKEIEFDTIYDDEMTKRYNQINNEDYERIVRVKKLEKKKGVIIGDCYKCDGIYNIGDKFKSKSLYNDDYTNPSFIRNKTVQFWIVSIGLNVTVLVPKIEVEDFRYVQEIENEVIEWKNLI